MNYRRLPGGLATVERFARALDDEDYALAETLLADDCWYVCRGERFRGPSAIIGAYRDNGAAAQRFDAIVYDSVVAKDADGAYRIRFVDHLSHAGQRFTFQCEQLVRLDESGMIASIEHVDLPGQVAALAEFRQQVADGSAH
jgi:hypothetical protein